MSGEAVLEVEGPVLVARSAVGTLRPVLGVGCGRGERFVVDGRRDVAAGYVIDEAAELVEAWQTPAVTAEVQRLAVAVSCREAQGRRVGRVGALPGEPRVL